MTSCLIRNETVCLSHMYMYGVIGQGSQLLWLCDHIPVSVPILAIRELVQSLLHGYTYCMRVLWLTGGIVCYCPGYSPPQNNTFHLIIYCTYLPSNYLLSGTPKWLPHLISQTFLTSMLYIHIYLLISLPRTFSQAFFPFALLFLVHMHTFIRILTHARTPLYLFCSLLYSPFLPCYSPVL